MLIALGLSFYVWPMMTQKTTILCFLQLFLVSTLSCLDVSSCHVSQPVRERERERERKKEREIEDLACVFTEANCKKDFQKTDQTNF